MGQKNILDTHHTHHSTRPQHNTRRRRHRRIQNTILHRMRTRTLQKPILPTPKQPKQNTSRTRIPHQRSIRKKTTSKPHLHTIPHHRTLRSSTSSQPPTTQQRKTNAHRTTLGKEKTRAGEETMNEANYLIKALTEQGKKAIQQAHEEGKKTDTKGIYKEKIIAEEPYTLEIRVRGAKDWLTRARHKKTIKKALKQNNARKKDYTIEDITE